MLAKEVRMTDRGTTNLLLAVIAAVLLFGSTAVTGAIKWIAIVALIMFVIYAALSLVRYFIRESGRELTEAKAQGRDALIITAVGWAFLGFLPFLGGYAVLLWLDGAPRPIDAVASSLLGKAWLGLLLVGGTLIAASQLYSHRTNIIPALRYLCFLAIRSPLAPFFLCFYGWRKARNAGDGAVSSAATALLGFFFGLMVWAILAGLFLPFFGL
jgi:hypothetical protein